MSGEVRILSPPSGARSDDSLRRPMAQRDTRCIVAILDSLDARDERGGRTTLARDLGTLVRRGFSARPVQGHRLILRAPDSPNGPEHRVSSER